MTQLNTDVQSHNGNSGAVSPLSGKPYTPESLADRWSCSAEKVRQMISQGQLTGFRLGKLIRIPKVEVERFECLTIHALPDTNLLNTEERLLSHSAGERAVVEFRLARMIRG